ncbi:MAG: Lrp/AsnC family transcriptional regulator [Clostridium sp.]|jgi:DNA-binding Lrp family transcriptional regulator|uniref:siroheme decarboxylase subunit beta n=1 Tax=Clostridium sp. TaxID=1506 RepID=UPI0025BA8800|nr:Lrp/AsnC family transcriptional regulator [Clostridium sp.]MCH3963543.1 Lrp/AsnC family transcriptional regulator [Clostridium sp.]MCI1714684.1 Lrp/AsnC family transcriptional regulator [Clostridium sp.]MCI1799127.1 Lrp/AsnC family transcriptional regulator [Clostridium sp.]MCI1812867.1 Lrp/AsnC family transcriptional regulator [Clostridium sp.]MCI1869757.1 Lrp/AsnC family transcriptional regulator [Clostridium sp.]
MLSDLDINIIRKIQGEIPIVPEPYKQISRELGIPKNLLLKRIEKLLDRGVIRRFGAVVNHRNAGFMANAMVVWKVPEEKIRDAVDTMTIFAEVSHCYRRSVPQNWAYNIFTMIHGNTKGDCEKVIEKISKEIGISDYEILYSTCEFKKTSMKYFD